MAINSAKGFFKDIYFKRKLLYDLAKRDFTSGYHGSTFGIIWVFVEPIVYIGILWFFFTKGVRYNAVSDHPFLVWLMCGMVLWTFVSNALSGSPNVFSGHSYLLKQWGFNMSVLPFTHVISMLFLHVVMLGLLIILLFMYGIPFSFWWFQSLYYIFAASVLIIGTTWFTASLSLFLKDVSNVISIILQFGFWVSPIFWDINTYPEKFRFLLKLNPLYHIIIGYRESFLYHRGFWEDTNSFLYFWGFTFVISAVGYKSYRRLRPFFGDVI